MHDAVCTGMVGRIQRLTELPSKVPSTMSGPPCARPSEGDVLLGDARKTSSEHAPPGLLDDVSGPAVAQGVLNSESTSVTSRARDRSGQQSTATPEASDAIRPDDSVSQTKSHAASSTTSARRRAALQLAADMEAKMLDDELQEELAAIEREKELKRAHRERKLKVIREADARMAAVD